MAFEPGSLPGFDASVLGIEIVSLGPVAPDGKMAAGAKTAATNGATPRAAAPTSTSPAAANAEPPRPKRAGKKRRYDEHSFEGYGEGFVDDDVDGAAGVGGGGYSTSDGGEKRGGKKKRKKVSVDDFAGDSRGSGRGLTVTELRVLWKLRHFSGSAGEGRQLRRGHGRGGKRVRGTVTRVARRDSVSARQSHPLLTSGDSPNSHRPSRLAPSRCCPSPALLSHTNLLHTRAFLPLPQSSYSLHISDVHPSPARSQLGVRWLSLSWRSQPIISVSRISGQELSLFFDRRRRRQAMVASRCEYLCF